MKILQLLRTRFRFSHYLIIRLKHLTWHKLINFLVVEYEYFLRRSTLRGFPYELIIDPTNICQLRCPLCPTGLGQPGRQKGYMDLRLFKRIIDKVKPYTFHVFLHNWGEPLFHKDLIQMIKYAHHANIGTTLSTNLNHSLSEQSAEALIHSGLETLVVSLDGTTQEAYEKYRVGGNISKVIQNVEMLVQKRQKAKSPYLEWQFLVNKYNEHQIEEAKAMAKDLGVDGISFVNLNLPHNVKDEELVNAWFPQNIKYRNKVPDKADDLLNGNCWWLWRTMIINWDGGTAFCCYIDESQGDIGNCNYEDLREIWNNRNYQSARNLFSKNRINFEVTTICHKCSVPKR